MVIEPLAVAELVALDEAVELEQPSFSRQENCVEYWNSPVPSTMISMPYPVSVPCVPGVKSHGTDQS
jgi:hypothetical protein